MNKDEQHIDLREKLKKLPRIKARDGFESELLRRINLLEPLSVKSKPGKNGLWDILFGKKSLAWTIPAVSLAVIGIVVLSIYLSVFNTGDMKKQTSELSLSNEKLPASSDALTKETTKSSIPGKDLVNDLEIGKSPSPEKKEINKGYNETYILRSPKTEAPSKVNVIDSRKETTPPEKGNEVKKNGNPPGEIDKAVEKSMIKEESRIENNNKGVEPDKKISAPLIKDNDKIKSDIDKNTGIKAKEDVKKKMSKNLTKEILEKLKQKIIDN
ncbi:MAG: hypothetical protein WC644_00925 [Ignavibacteria bacterium]